MEGLTGHIEFNSKGQRSNYALRIMQNSKDGLRQVSHSQSYKSGTNIIHLQSNHMPWIQTSSAHSRSSTNFMRLAQKNFCMNSLTFLMPTFSLAITYLLLLNTKLLSTVPISVGHCFWQMLHLSLWQRCNSSRIVQEGAVKRLAQLTMLTVSRYQKTNGDKN